VDSQQVGDLGRHASASGHHSDGASTKCFANVRSTSADHPNTSPIGTDDPQAIRSDDSGP